MATVLASDNTAYHLWGYPDFNGWEPEESLSFTELENELSDGYFSNRLLGADTGVRSWKLKFPSLAALSVLPTTLTSIDNAPVSRLDYIRSLYAESKVSGTPFVFPSPVNNQYFLVRFADPSLTLSRAKATLQLYSTGIELKQIRLSGKTVFSLAKVLAAPYWYDETSHASPSWNNATGSPTVAVIDSTGGPTFGANPQNGHNTVRLDGVNDVLYLDNYSFGLPNFYDVFLVMKQREATFSNNAGIFTDANAAGQQVLVGTSGNTKFQNFSLSNFEYRMNGLLYPQTNMQAPMNTWGVIHMRFIGGAAAPASFWQIGQNRATAATFAKADIGQIVISAASNLPLMDCRGIVEHLAVKWGVV